MMEARSNSFIDKTLQFLTATCWAFLVLFGGLFALVLFCYLAVNTRYSWIVRLYLLWIWVLDVKTAERGGRRSIWCRKLKVWKYMGDYFPIKVVKVPDAEFDPKKNYILCSFPHGIFPVGAFYTFCYEDSGFNDIFPHHTSYPAVIKHQFLFPLIRDVGLALGAITPSIESLEYVLSKPQGGSTCNIVVGGAKEACYCKPGTYRLNLKNRKGFVRLALRNGCPLVPVFSFGETDLYDQLEGPILRRIQDWCRKWLGVIPILILGRGIFQSSFGIVPRKHPVTTVIGKPLVVPKIKEPTKEEINEHHSKFTAKLMALFEEQKYNYLKNAEDQKLIID